MLTCGRGRVYCPHTNKTTQPNRCKMLPQSEYILDVFEDESTGETGLKFANMPHLDMPMAILEGRTLSHDLLEHVNGQDMIGGVADEIMAIGAIWFVRGDYCDIIRGPYRDIRSPDEIIAGDMYNILSNWITSDQDWGDYQLDPDYNAEDSPNYETSKEILNVMLGQHNLEPDDEGEIDIEGEYFDQNVLDEYLEKALIFMCQGYDRAYEKYDQFQVNRLFWNLAEVVDQFIAKTELIPGQQFKLTLDFEDLTGSITSMEPWHTIEIRIEGEDDFFTVYEDQLDIEQLEYLFDDCGIANEDDQIAIHEELVSVLADAEEDQEDVFNVGDYEIKYTLSMFTGY